jgi:FtsZ-binding cell division protein ZapB
MENGFELLEDKVRKAVELVKRLRKENKDLRDELGKAQPRLQELEKKVEALDKHRGAATAEAGKAEARPRGQGAAARAGGDPAPHRQAGGGAGRAGVSPAYNPAEPGP